MPRTLALFFVLAASARAQEAVPTRFYRDQIGLRVGQHLDLDSGGVFHSSVAPSGVRCELTADEHHLTVPERWQVDPLAGDLLGGLWLSGMTDEGRRAWVQAPPVFERSDFQRIYPVRLLVRVSGDAPLRAAPAGLSARGLGEAILLEWQLDEAYARYRVERRASDGSFVELAEHAGSRWVDVDLAEEQDVFAYRVTGFTPEGSPGLSARAQATRDYSGPFEGTAVFGNHGSWAFDLIRQRVEPELGHLRLAGTYGGGAASLSDPFGVRILRPDGSEQLSPGHEFVLPFSDGGDARCQLVSVGDWKVTVDYRVRLDASSGNLNDLLALIVEGDGVRLDLDLPDGARYSLAATRRDLVTGRDALIQHQVDGFFDSAPPARSLLEYRVDFDLGAGMPTITARAVLDRRPYELIQGSLELEPGTGWSFVRGQSTDEDPADLRITVLPPANGTLELECPAGGTNFEGPKRYLRAVAPDDRLAVVIGAADPVLTSAVQLGPHDGELVVMRTAHGGWVRLRYRGHDEGRARFDYVFNPRGGHFVEATPDEELSVNGILFDLARLDLETRHQVERRFGRQR